MFVSLYLNDVVNRRLFPYVALWERSFTIHNRCVVVKGAGFFLVMCFIDGHIILKYKTHRNMLDNTESLTRSSFRSQVVLLPNDIFLFLLSECGSIVNNTLRSPGYPNNYPGNMDCNYSVPIPSGKEMKVIFDYFDVQYHSDCE